MLGKKRISVYYIPHFFPIRTARLHSGHNFRGTVQHLAVRHIQSLCKIWRRRSRVTADSRVPEMLSWVTG